MKHTTTFRGDAIYCSCGKIFMSFAHAKLHADEMNKLGVTK